MTGPTKTSTNANASDFAYSLRKGLLLAVVALVLILPPVVWFLPAGSAPAVVAMPPASSLAIAAQPAPQSGTVRRAEFGQEEVSVDVRKMANWVVHTGDHRKSAFVIVDKKHAKVYVFSPLGQLKAATPALLGSAQGDDPVPGIGEKPLSQVLPQEKTTPAGRFVAELGVNTKGEDIVWVDYDTAVSMHRVRAVKDERRMQRLASPTAEDNRISFGCINLPVKFYEKVLKPTVQASGAVIYVLPETRPLRQMFASFYDVEVLVKVAQR
jgi:hypothetical protein